jgi:hypothetical protein
MILGQVGVATGSNMIGWSVEWSVSASMILVYKGS